MPIFLTLFVEEAECVVKFVHDRPRLYASGIKRDRLFAPGSPDKRIASIIGMNIEIVPMSHLVSRHKSNARLLVELLHRTCDDRSRIRTVLGRDCVGDFAVWPSPKTGDNLYKWKRGKKRWGKCLDRSANIQIHI